MPEPVELPHLHRAAPSSRSRTSIPSSPSPAPTAHALPGLWCRARPPIGLPGVRAMRLGAVRVNRATMPRTTHDPGPNAEPQFALPLAARPALRPAAALPLLDERLRGTRFVTLEPRSVLNSPEQTGVDFWSLNPYVG